MNIIKVLRPVVTPVKLIRQTGVTVQLIRSSDKPVRLVNEGGVTNLGGATDASQITIQTHLRTYYNLQKQL